MITYRATARQQTKATYSFNWIPLRFIVEQLANFLYDLYSAFVLRDLVYLCLGAVPVLYAIRRKFPGAVDFLKQYPKISVSAFVVTAYIGGIAIYHCAVLVKIVHVYPPCEEKQQSSEPACLSSREQQVASIIALAHLQESHPGKAVRYVERIIYMKQMTGAAGLAIGISALVFLLDGFPRKPATPWTRLKWLGMVLVLGSLSAGSLWTNRETAQVQEMIIKDLSNDLNKQPELPDINKKPLARKRRPSKRR
ncbi:MAG: hypothetical protein ACRER2_00365 [Methylococcales bacterium]